MTNSTFKTSYITPHSIQSIVFQNSPIGFGSTLIHLIGLVEYCVRHEIDFQFDRRGILSLYLDGSEDPWQRVFGDDSFKDVKFNHSRKHSVFVSLPHSFPFFTYMQVCDDKTLFISDKWARKFNPIIKDFLPLSAEMKEQIQKDKEYVMVGNVLGVHLRGTDSTNHGKAVSLEDRIEQIKTYMIDKNYDRIFLITDESSYLTKAIQVFGDKLVFLRDVKRSESNLSLHHHRNLPIGLKLLYDIVREMNILSMCNGQVLGRSGVSAVIRCMNPDVPYKVFDDPNLPKHDLAAWKNKLSEEQNVSYTTLEYQ